MSRPKKQQNRSQISIRSADYELLVAICDAETRSITDQVSVIFREYSKRLGLGAPSKPSKQKRKAG